MSTHIHYLHALFFESVQLQISKLLSFFASSENEHLYSLKYITCYAEQAWCKVMVYISQSIFYAANEVYVNSGVVIT